MKRFVLLLAASLFGLSGAVSARTIGFADLRGIVSLSDPQISPDGSRIAFVRSTQDFSRDRRHARLMLFDLRSRSLRALTFDRGAGEPRWSPKGSLLAFLSPGVERGAGKDKKQIFVLRFDGGDPQQITRAPQGVDEYAWSPNGAAFAYVMQDAPPKREISFRVGDNDYLHQGVSMPSHLWVVNARGGTARRLTSGSWSLAIADPYVTPPVSWSADGSKIAFVRFPNALNGDTLGAVVDVIDVRSGKIAQLTRNSGLEGDPEFAPAGRAIAYRRNEGGDPTSGDAIFVTHYGSRSAGVDLRRKIGRTIEGTAWSADGKSMWLFGPDGDRTAGWYVSRDGARVKKIDLGGVGLVSTGPAAKTGALAFIGSTTLHPPELYYLRSPEAAPVRLTDENGRVASLQLGRVVAVHWRNDGFAENGILTLPPGYDPHRAYPLVLIVHGGPQAASMLGWNGQNQIFAAHRYLVFNPNYRGSTNMGDAYERAIDRDAGAGPGRDVMAGVAAVERTYDVDRSRIAVTGWSYGGYMTSWMEGHYHIWKAAVAGAALNDWFDDYNVAFYVHTDVPWFGGSPWDPKYSSMWRSQSPISYAQQIRTPTLILGDIGDNNVTITNSFKMYHALKDNGVPVQFVAYPVHGHFPTDPAQSEDVQMRWLGWVDKYLKGGK